MKVRTIVALAALALVATACTEDTTPTVGGTTTPPQTGSPTPTATASSEEVPITLQNSRFIPSQVSIKVGQPLDLTNEDDFTHNLTITGTSIDVDIEGGEDADVETATLSPGSHPFFCKYHRDSGMTGTLEAS